MGCHDLLRPLVAYDSKLLHESAGLSSMLGTREQFGTKGRCVMSLALCTLGHAACESSPAWDPLFACSAGVACPCNERLARRCAPPPPRASASTCVRVMFASITRAREGQVTKAMA